MEPALARTPPGEVVQFERLGYFARDPHVQPAVVAAHERKSVVERALEGPLLFHRTVGLRDEWANIQKRRQQRP